MNGDRTCETFYFGKKLKEEVMVALSPRNTWKETRHKWIKEILKRIFGQLCI